LDEGFVRSEKISGGAIMKILNKGFIIEFIDNLRDSYWGDNHTDRVFDRLQNFINSCQDGTDCDYKEIVKSQSYSCTGNGYRMYHQKFTDRLFGCIRGCLQSSERNFFDENCRIIFDISTGDCDSFDKLYAA
jgi:hypothetical protein